jgi:folate/biopterin transporter
MKNEAETTSNSNIVVVAMATSTTLPAASSTNIQQSKSLVARQEEEEEEEAERSYIGPLDASASFWTSYLRQTLFFGVEMNRETWAICTIYFVEGALGLARLAQSYLLKDELRLGPAELSALTGLLVLPWTIKPLYGFLSDGFPLFGYKRKSYLIAAGLVGGLSYGVLSYQDLWEGLSPAASVTGTVAALLLSSACIAFSDVVADGMVVTRTREYSLSQQQQQQDTDANANADDSAAMAGGLQSLCWGAASLGALLSAYFSGSLLEVLPARAIFGITAVLPFLVALIAVGIDETRVVVTTTATATDVAVVDYATNDDNRNNEEPPTGDETETTLPDGDGVNAQVALLWQTLRQPSIWKPTLFLFLWQSTPTADGAFFFFLTNDLQLGPEFLGRVRLVTAAAGLLGVWVYNQYLKRVKIKDILFWSTIASFPLGLLPVLLITHVNRGWGIPDTMLIYGDDVVLAVLGQISFLPTLVLAARLCPPGVEAVLFATLMSIFNGAGTVGTELGALLTQAAGITDTNFDNLAALTVLCNVTSLWPLLLIGWLDGIGDGSEQQQQQEQQDEERDGK